MKILTILGSPRKKGNTATVLALFEKRIGADHDIERINILNKAVKGCLGCDSCQKVDDQPACVQKDDFMGIFDKIITADLIVYASPVYVWDFSAQLKALIDRHYCLVKWKNRENTHYLLEGKRTALLSTCGGSAEKNADLIKEIFSREMNYLHCQIVGKYIVPFCTTPEELGEKARKTAHMMHTDIMSSFIV